MSTPLPTILIVDDSGTTRSMIKRVISMTRLPIGPVREAADGKAALAVMEASRIDLVLADLNMPVMSGVEMIGCMRQSAKLRHIPVVVISAQPDEGLIEQLKRDGVAGYLPKPFTPENVRDMISPLLADTTPLPAELPPSEPQPGAAPSLNLSLAESLAEALETMAFISPQPPTGTLAPCAPGDLRLVRVCFHDSRRAGSLVIAAPHQFGVLVAGNCSSSDDPSVVEMEADDALKELANIVCGLLLRKRPSGSAGFEMTTPILERGEEFHQLCAAKDVVSLEADGFLITAHVTSESPRPDLAEASHGG